MKKRAVKKSKKKETLTESVGEQYKIAWSYVKESRNYIYLVIILFFAFTLIGFFVQVPEPFRSQLIDYFKNLVEQTKGMGLIDLISFIFSNNALSGFMGIFFGFILGIFPFFSAVFNGFVLGFASNLSASQEGILSLWRLLPHGIFELPAIFISFGIGIKFSTFVSAKHKWKKFVEYFEKSISVYIFIVIPLLVIAAIIEGTLIFLGI